MSRRGDDQVARIEQDLACLNCRYNLRGLEGPVVTCPECGRRFDVAELIMRRWVGTYRDAPGVKRVMWPVAWLFAGGMAAVVAGLVELALFNVVAGTVLAGWPLWLGALRGMMPRGRAVALSLLAHILLIGYLACILGPLALIPLAECSLGVDTLAAILVVIPLLAVLTPLLVVVWSVCRRGERFIARCCLRQYLIDRGRPATMRA